MRTLEWKRKKEEVLKNGKYLIGRQPIVNRDREVVAYELLFRSGGSETASFADHSQATANVIVNTLTRFGVEDILGERQGFLNLELELLMDDSLSILPKQQVVLELLETLAVTPELVERCRFLKKNGFTLALDDHRYDPAFQELYQIVDIVKVDLIRDHPDRLAETVEHLGGYPLRLLAEKVETREEFRLCLDLGFDLFQGYYFGKPSTLEMSRLDLPGATLKNLMLLLDQDAKLTEIEGICRGNAGLTRSLTMLANSIGSRTLDKIGSASQAISLLGRQQVRRWVQLALSAG